MATAKEYYQAQDAEFARQRAAKQAADDARIISYAEDEPNKLGMVDRWFGGVERARERQALQVPPEPVRTGPPPEPPAGISQAGLPLDALATAGIRPSALDPQRIVANAAVDTDKAVARNVATKEQGLADIRAANRAAIEKVDMSDLDDRMAALAAESPTGRLEPILLSKYEKMKQDRLNAARQGVQVNDARAISDRTAARQEKALEGVLKDSAAAQLRNDVPDSVKLQLRTYESLLADPMVTQRAIQSGVDPMLEINSILLGLVDKEIATREGVQGKAEGGEVEDMGMELPGAIDEAPIDMNSGDYVIPVEAMRFYGHKFFQDLINKAEDAVE